MTNESELSIVKPKSVGLFFLKWADAARATRLHRIRRRPFADIFHPFHYTQHCYIFLSVTRTDTRRCPMVSFHSDPSLSDPTESVCRHFPPLSLHYLAVYFLRLSRIDCGESDGLLPRQSVSIGSDGVRYRHFSPLSLLYFAVCFLSI